MKVLFSFIGDFIKVATTGGVKYHLWMGIVSATMAVGLYCYIVQIQEGLAVTGMRDVVSWGLYISNFTFLVGLAAAAVMIVLPTYILHDVDFKKAVLVGEGVAVGALIMCLAFVTVDLGSPERIWHMLPFVGYFNWPQSMLTWDVIVLNGYLLLNLFIPAYLLYQHYQGKSPDQKKYLPFVILSVFWAVSIHLVTAFLYAGLPARPFWHNALLGPRFLASAFAAGPAFIILVLAVINKFTKYSIQASSFSKLSLIIAIASQINLIMLGSELFKEFYHPTEHSASAALLFFGFDKNPLISTWIWTAILANIACTIILTINPLRNKTSVLFPVAGILFVSIWAEKGMGLIIPGFLPGPWGEFVAYFPSGIEIGVTAGIWALGFFVMTILVKVAVAIELREVQYKP